MGDREDVAGDVAEMRELILTHGLERIVELWVEWQSLDDSVRVTYETA